MSRLDFARWNTATPAAIGRVVRPESAAPSSGLSDEPPAHFRRSGNSPDGTPNAKPVRGRRRGDIALLTGCQDPHYAFGLSMSLAAAGTRLDLIGSPAENSPAYDRNANLTFLAFRGSTRSERTLVGKLYGWLLYYCRLLAYTVGPTPSLLHILWNNKFEVFDRTLLMLYYRICGKSIVLTAHNVNQGRRDSRDSFLNRLTLRWQYRLCDHVFVHTAQMKKELCTQFFVRPDSVTVIPYGMNNAVPDTDLTSAEAKARLGVSTSDKTILFFGGIKPYKGLEYLVEAFHRLPQDAGYRLVIAGERKRGAERYFEDVQARIARGCGADRIIQKIQRIPDQEAELYFKAADVIALPYKDIFQSGILFLAYAFGLPVVATDVGSIADEVIEGTTGYVCQPGDPDALAAAIRRYFHSDLFRELDARREAIKALTNSRHSWSVVVRMTQDVYRPLLRLRQGHDPLCSA